MTSCTFTHAIQPFDPEYRATVLQNLCTMCLIHAKRHIVPANQLQPVSINEIPNIPSPPLRPLILVLWGVLNYPQGPTGRLDEQKKSCICVSKGP